MEYILYQRNHLSYDLKCLHPNSSCQLSGKCMKDRMENMHTDVNPLYPKIMEYILYQRNHLSYDLKCLHPNSSCQLSGKCMKDRMENMHTDVNPLYPNISMHILYTVLYTFSRC